jgi:hypothetical protein
LNCAAQVGTGDEDSCEVNEDHDFQLCDDCVARGVNLNEACQ